jgi:hypothetical protein
MTKMPPSAGPLKIAAGKATMLLLFNPAPDAEQPLTFGYQLLQAAAIPEIKHIL